MVYCCTMNVDEMIANAERLSLSYTERGRYTGRSDACGSWRSVAYFDDYVVKSVQEAQDRDCQMEWDFYVGTTDEVRAFLAKPLYISRNGRSIVMEKLKPMQWEDDKATNFGRRDDGTVVWLDYGNLIYDIRTAVEFDEVPLTKREYTKMEHFPKLRLTPTLL